MPCAAKGLVNITKKEVKDYTVTHPYTPLGIFRPADLQQLVRCIQQAESEGRSVRAQGSGYSLSKAAVADDYLVCTDALNKWLSRPIPSATTNPNWFRSDAHNRDYLAGLVRSSVMLAKDKDATFVHVEAGVKIKDLLAQLDSAGLALHTMGAGGGQSLAGAMSTGTHGSDFKLPPLFDFVRAIHLVGPGGQEWWIEPSSGFAQGGKLPSLPGWCPETKVVRDDEWFRAPIVAVGRFGVIYSVVLEVTAQFKLLDKSDKGLSWSSVRSKLKESKVEKRDDGTASLGGVFVRESPESDKSPLRFYQVTVDLAKGEKCWVTRRWKTTKAGSKNTSSSAPASFDLILCSSPGKFGPALTAMQFIPEVVVMKTTLGLTPIMGPVWVANIDALFVELAALAATSATVGEFLAKIAERLSGLTDAQYGAAGRLRDLIRTISETVIDSEHADERWGLSHEIVDGHPDKRRGCLSAHSSEYFFDASSDDYLRFVDAVLDASTAHGIPGYASLRFTGRSKCHLAMERYPLTVAIEIAVPRKFGSTGDLFEAFNTAVVASAKKYEGIPHWGQRHVLNSEATQELYGASLESFRYPLSEIENGHPRTFSTQFTRNRGLEVTDPKILHRVRTKRDDGAMMASMIPALLSAL